MKNQTIGEVAAKHVGSEKREPTHFYHTGMKKIYGLEMGPHLDYAEDVLSRWQAGRDVWPHAKRKKRPF